MRAHMVNLGVLDYADKRDIDKLNIPEKFTGDLAMGVAIVFDNERRKSSTIEFGPFVSWSPKVSERMRHCRCCFSD